MKRNRGVAKSSAGPTQHAVQAQQSRALGCRRAGRSGVGLDLGGVAHHVELEGRRSRQGGHVHRLLRFASEAPVGQLPVAVDELLHCAEPRSLRGDEVGRSRHLPPVLVIERHLGEEGPVHVDGDGERRRVQVEQSMHVVRDRFGLVSGTCGAGFVVRCVSGEVVEIE